MLETATNLAVGLIALVAIWIIYQDRREQKFLVNLRPFFVEHLPLYDALVTRAGYIFWIGVYFMALAAAGAVLSTAGQPPLVELFPPLRVINALAILGLLAGPIYYGRAMRRLPPQQ